MAQPDFYHLNVKSNNVKFTCYLNGFPVYSAEDKFDATVSMPVQLYLIGTDNKLRIEAEVIDKMKMGTIKADIEAYQKGDIVATDDAHSGEMSLEMEVKDTANKELTFNNERFDFSALLVNGDQLTEEQLMAYAKKLHKYVENADAAGFVKEMALKIADYSSAHEYTAEQMHEGLTQQLKQTFFSKKQAGISDDRISLAGFDDGRIWEIKIDGEEFLKYKEEGGSMQMSVYVGSVNGSIGIVR